MVKDSAAKKFDTIIVWKLDCFARNRYDSAHYKSILRKNGVRVVSATESGRMLYEEKIGWILQKRLIIMYNNMIEKNIKI